MEAKSTNPQTCGGDIFSIGKELHILVVDPNANFLRAVTTALEKHSFTGITFIINKFFLYF